MTFDDRAAHGQADPHALRLGGEERLEELLRIAGIKTHAAVAHGNTHATVVVEARPDGELARSIIDSEHGIRGIREQVEDDLLKLNSVAYDDGEVAGQLQTQH